MHYKIEWNEQLLGGAVIIYGLGVEPRRNVFLGKHFDNPTIKK